MMHRGPVVGIRAWSEIGYDLRQQSGIRKVAEDETRSRSRAAHPIRDRQMPREESARPGRVDHEVRAQLERSAVASPGQRCPARVEGAPGDLHAVAVVDARRLRLTHKVMIYIGP